MATMLDIVERAYRKIRVTGDGDPLEAVSAAEGITALNDMLHEWKTRGVDLAYADLKLTDVFPLEPQFREGTVYMLASRLAPEYARPREFDADDFFRNIQSAYMVIEPVTMPNGLVRTPSSRDWGWY